MRAWRALFLIHWRLFLREPVAVFFTLFFPTLLLLLYGSAFGHETVPNSNLSYLDVELPALLVLIPLSMGLMGLPGSVAAEREYGVLKRFAVTPLPPLTYLSAYLGTQLAINLVGALATFAVGRLVYHLAWPAHPWQAIFIFLVGVLALSALGFALAAFAPSTRTAQVLGMVLFYPMLFLSGITFPVELFPTWMQKLAEVWPVTHLYRLMLQAWFDAPPQAYAPLPAWLALLGLLILGMVALSRFRWVED